MRGIVTGLAVAAVAGIAILLGRGTDPGRAPHERKAVVPVPPPPVPQPKPATPATPAFVVVGRVAGEGRLPLVGASARFADTDGELGRAESDEAGGFRLEATRTPGDPLWLYLRHGDEAHGYPIRRPDRALLDVGTVVLLPKRRLEVEVRAAGAPVPGAAVEIQYGARATCDERGLAAFDCGRAGERRIFAFASGHGRGMVQSRADRVRIDLPVERTVALVFVDAVDGTPVVGARFDVTEMLPTEHGHEVWPRPADTAGADGVATLRGLTDGMRLDLTDLGAPGYPVHWRHPFTVEVNGRDERIEVPVTPGRTVRWPLEPPSPGPDETFEARVHVRGGIAPIDARARVEGGSLVVEGLPPGPVQLHLMSSAGLYGRAGEHGGLRPVAFTAAPSLDVLVTDAAGAPCADEAVAIGAHVVRTDADGRARFDRIWLPRLEQRHAKCAGRAPVEFGDGKARFEIVRKRTVTVQVRIGGRPTLPRHYWWSGRGLELRVVAEDPHAGTLTVRYRPLREHGPVDAKLNNVPVDLNAPAPVVDLRYGTR